ncbi:MAG: hypothetical protein R2879_11480 [Saprospiraceae bacterium]
MKTFKNLSQPFICAFFIFLFGSLSNRLSAQTDTSFQYAVYLDPLAFVNNKQSLHIGGETYLNGFLLGTEADFYVGILEGASGISDEGFSFGITGKAGLDLLPSKRKLMHLGIAFRYDRLHIEDMDFDPFQTVFGNSLFYKSWNQLTPMMFFQVNTFNTKRIFMGVQINVGKTFLTNIKSERLNKSGEEKNSNDFLFDFPGVFPDAPIPSNRKGVEYQSFPDIRLNVWIGYRFGIREKIKIKD